MAENIVEDLSPTEEALEAVNPRQVIRFRIVPLEIASDGTLVVALEDTEAYEVLDDLSLALGRPVRGVQAAHRLSKNPARGVHVFAPPSNAEPTDR